MAGKGGKGGKEGRRRAKQQQQVRQRRQPSQTGKRAGRTRRSASSFNGAKIEEYMATHGIVRKPIVGDGNCLFRALADQLGLGEGSHWKIREKVTQTIKSDHEYFVNFIDSDEIDGVEAYCDEMMEDGRARGFRFRELTVGVWGGDIELEAF